MIFFSQQPNLKSVVNHRFKWIIQDSLLISDNFKLQNEVLQAILTDLCASGGEEFCAPSLLRVQDLMTSCNFLPVSTLPFKGKYHFHICRPCFF